MKKSVYILIISSLLWSCGGGGGDDPAPPPPVANKAPSIPVQTAPTNNLLCIDNNVTFQWDASIDPEGDAISYEIQVATDDQFSQNIQTSTGTGTSTSITLDKGIAYYWRVKAKDSKNASSNYSSIFSFYTEGDGEANYLPFLPVLVEPALNTVIQTGSTILKWTASDVDNDPLVFDIYVDTFNPPTNLVSENQSDSNFEIDLTASQNYYWRVVVKDNNGGQTIGQVWNFKTD